MLRFSKSFFHILMIFNEKATTFKTMSLRLSMKSSKYVNFWTLVLNKILILTKLSLQRYISCRHLNFDPTYQIGSHGDFLPFWKSGILGASWQFCGLHQNFFGSNRAIYERETKIFSWLKIFYGTLLQSLGCNIELIRTWLFIIW